jgi:N-methylhydantoinase A/oxoprolinase/acetone carboxylase beta subunit
MKLIIGIDTGGTYTDAAVLDKETGKVLASAKALTTKDNLESGIENALRQVPEEFFSQCEMVALSTTLATNACVEKKYGKAKLILFGTDKESALRITSQLGEILPEDLICIDTKTKFSGEIPCMPDWRGFAEMVQQECSECDVVAVSEVYTAQTGSVLEKKARDVIQSVLGKTVVCGYELFEELGFIKRGLGAYLNGKLIPLIDEFLSAVKGVMGRLHINCPISIVRSDGTLMSVEYTRLHPIETLLCGPVASVMGAGGLTEEKDAYVIDMGGTTSDIAILRGRAPAIVSGGITIGDWKTFVKGVYIDTFGLGGDSEVKFQDNEPVIMDTRVIPISILASEYPQIGEELSLLRNSEWQISNHAHEYYKLSKEIENLDEFPEHEREIICALRKNPMSMRHLAKVLKVSVSDLRLRSLESRRIIMKSGLTPTDIMHVRGDFTDHDVLAARNLAVYLAHIHGYTLDELCEKVYDRVKFKMYRNIIRASMVRKYSAAARDGLNEVLEQMISYQWEETKLDRKGFSHSDSLEFRALFKLEYPLIGIGGPIKVFAEDVAGALSTRAVIPENFRVANAIGAAICNMEVTAQALVTYVYDNGGGVTHLRVSSKGEAITLEPKEEERAWSLAEQLARKQAAKEALARGYDEDKLEIQVERTDKYFIGFGGIMETLFIARAK